MSGVHEIACMDENLSRELYFLIIKFLSEGPCSSAAEVLKREVEAYQLLPKGINWLGEETPRNFTDTAIRNPHIQGDFLQKICQRLLPLLEQTIPPSVKGVSSLLGASQHSLLRPPQVPGHLLTSNHLTVCHHGAPIAPGFKTKNTFNLTNVVNARQASGTVCKRNFLQHGLYSKMSMHRRILGHLSAVYCVLFDQTGQSIITGADDNLVKIWSSSDGRLLATLRGHSAEISDIAVNCENTLLAAGSCDKTIRVWDIQTTAPVGVLQGHTGSITSLQFCPSCFGDFRYLMSTGGDATVTFWKYDLSTKKFDDAPVKFQEKSRPGAQIICSSFSPGGVFLVTGNTDHNIRIYQISPGPPERIAELTAHLDHVDSIQFSHSSERFLSGSKDGTARIWFYQRSEWKSIALNSQQQLPGSSPPREEDTNKITKIRVTMVGWNFSDQYVVTAVNDHSVKVWESNTGKLIYVLKGHQDEIFIIEAHPVNPQLLLTAGNVMQIMDVYECNGHDGYIILWNLTAGKIVKKFYNSLQGQGHGAVFDCKFSPDGQRFATTDSHGHLAIYGFGSSEPYQKVPEEQFFHSDYRPVMRDMNNHVLDEQTQTAPHLMPPPFLVDVDGNPHPVFYQRLIPGHSSNIRPRRSVVASPPPVPSSPLPPLLAQIEQFERGGVFPEPEALQSPPSGNNAPSLGSPGVSSRNRGLLQDGDIEGVRQLNVNIPIIQDVTEADIHAWRNRTIVPKLEGSEAKWDEECRLALGRQELLRYLREKKKRPLPSTSRSVSQTDKKAERFLRSRARPSNRRDRPRANEPRPVYNTRAAANNESDVEESGEDEVMVTPSDSDDDDLPWNSSSSETSEYSDWTEEVGMNTRQQSENQRPSRRVRRVISSSDEEGETTTQQAKPVKKESDKPKKAPKKKKVPRKPRLDEIDEWLEYYRPPEWMTSIKLRRFPYVPQIGDEVYYFKQGHEMYVKEVLHQEAYEINPKKQCFSKLDLKAEELCKVVSLHYVVGPPTLVSLKLAILNPETGANTGGTFTVKYHDMADVLDFFILKQVYDQSLERDWRPGSRFRSVIDDYWWSGVITEVSPYQDHLPDSHFQCYVVSWDTGEVERMSPWDLEPIADDGSPVDSDANTSGVDSNNIPVTEEEHEALVKYIPQESEWPDEDYDTAITRLTRGLGIISELPFAGPFAYPVDVRSYPDYWSVVAYPVDLKAIIDRLANKYYRRKTALLWDVCQTGRNAKTYNEEDSEIVQNADKLVSILSTYIKDASCVDPLSLCEDASLENVEVDVEQVDASDVEGEAGQDASGSNKRKNLSPAGSVRKKSRRLELEAVDEYCLKEELLNLLNMLTTRSDAEPFREPVDLAEFPDYTDYVDEPIAFSTIRSRIECDYYHEPEQFIQDVRLVFSNSRKYNTNPKSRIYSMTLRLSALFGNKLDELLMNFYRNRTGGGRRTRQRSRRAVEDKPGTSGVSSPAQRASPRARPELVPRMSVRASTSRRREDDEGPSTGANGVDGLRMKISLTTRSVVSTTGLEEVDGGSNRSMVTSSRHQGTTNHLDDLPGLRTRSRSTVRNSFRESLSSTSSVVSETTPDAGRNPATQNGPVFRYSTRSRAPPTRLRLNGLAAKHESEDDDEEEEVSEDTGEESSEESESSSPRRGKNSRSSHSGKTSKTSSRKLSGSNSKGKQVVNAKRPIRTRSTSHYDDSASESDDDQLENPQLDVSSRGRIRRKASRMMDYV